MKSDATFYFPQVSCDCNCNFWRLFLVWLAIKTAVHYGQDNRQTKPRLSFPLKQQFVGQYKERKITLYVMVQVSFEAVKT